MALEPDTAQHVGEHERDLGGVEDAGALAGVEVEHDGGGRVEVRGDREERALPLSLWRGPFVSCMIRGDGIAATRRGAT